MSVLCDTGPLVSAADRSDDHHELAADCVTRLGRELLILDSVLVETDRLMRRRVGPDSARLFLSAVAGGSHRSAFLSPGLIERATELDSLYADLNLGLVDASIMAYAERHDLPIFTFGFRHFRATESARGPWRLLLSEQQVAERGG